MISDAYTQSQTCAHAHTQDQLRAAGIEQASSCVMIADKTSTKLVDGHFVDNAILRRFLSVQKFLVDQVREWLVDGSWWSMLC